MTHTPAPAEIETLRKIVAGRTCTEHDQRAAVAILDRLSPPEPDEAMLLAEGIAKHCVIESSKGDAPDEVDRWTLKSMIATAPQFGDGPYHAYQRTRQVLSELIASKDAEIAALGELRKVAARNAGAADQARFKAESELAALRAENERLKDTIADLGVDLDEWQRCERAAGNIPSPKAAERNTAEPADEGIPGKDYSDAKATDALKEAVALSRKRSVTDTAPVVEVTVDSGMGAEAVEQAELLWAQLPVNRKWTSIPTHEKALVCHLLSTYRTEAEARGRREALDKTDDEWINIATWVCRAFNKNGLAAGGAELKRLMTEGK